MIKNNITTEGGWINGLIGTNSESNNNSGNISPVIIYFKDIKPSYNSSYLENQTDKVKLKELLLSWGFSDADVSKVTSWKVYDENNIKFLWKGELLVKETCLHSLKCKNKTNTTYQICNDLKDSGYILLNTNADVLDGWNYIFIHELGFGMKRTNAFLDNSIDFLSNITDFMKYQNSDELAKIKVYEGYYDAKQYSVPLYKIQNQLLNGWGYPEKTDTDQKYTFSSNNVFSPYQYTKEPHRFLFSSVDIKSPWFLSNYFGKGGTEVDEGPVLQDSFKVENNILWYENKATGLKYEVVLKDSVKVIMYYREPGTMNYSSSLKSNFLCDVGIPSGSASISLPQQTIKYSANISSYPKLKMYDLTNLIKNKSACTIFSNTFFQKINNGEINIIDKSDENYKIFHSLWRPVSYTFPTINITNIEKEINNGNSGWNLTAINSASLDVSLPTGSINTYWVPADKDKSSLSLDIKYYSNFSIWLRGSKSYDAHQFSLSYGIASYIQYKGKSFPFYSVYEKQPSHTANASAGSGVINFSNKFSNVPVEKDVIGYSKTGTLEYKQGGGSVDTQLYKVSIDGSFLEGLYACHYPQMHYGNHHYAIAVWDLDHIDKTKYQENIPWSYINNGWDIGFYLFNYSKRNEAVFGSVETSSLNSMDGYFKRIVNFDEVLNYYPYFFIGYTYGLDKKIVLLKDLASNTLPEKTGEIKTHETTEHFESVTSGDLITYQIQTNIEAKTNDTLSVTSSTSWPSVDSWNVNIVDGKYKITAICKFNGNGSDRGNFLIRIKYKRY